MLHLLPLLPWLILLFVVCRMLVLRTKSVRTRRIRRERYEKAKQQRQELREENFQEQLQKPSFQSRLEKFSRFSEGEPVPCSRMRYWEMEDLEIGYVAPKPIEFIRMALIRLSKLIRGKPARGQK